MPKRLPLSTFLLFLVAWPSGCSYYATGPACLSQADCNPLKACGEMVQCVAGRCDPETTVDLPCLTECSVDADCPAGMHCRNSIGEIGVCVADGTCMTVDECEHLPAGACPAGVECRDEVCACLPDQGACSQDSDCTLVYSECCCPAGLDSYQAIRTDRLEDWYGRCPPIECAECFRMESGVDRLCWGGECIRARCDSDIGIGFCTVAAADPFECAADDDCTKLDQGGIVGGAVDPCCPCSAGGTEVAVNGGWEEAFLQDVWGSCHGIGEPPACYDVDMCTDRGPFCDQGRCALQSPCAQCPRTWAPVCGQDFQTVDNPCFAECRGLDWWHAEACVPGEGLTCAGLAGIECSSSALFCLIPPGSPPDSFGACILLGHCLVPSDCEYQPIDQPNCLGSWTCPEDTCVYVCD
jgi:hypothetical protein